MSEKDNEITKDYVDKKILESKLEMTEKHLGQLKFYMSAILIIFGLFFPLYTADQSSTKVDGAISKMEKRFEKLLGTQLTKPEIQCYYDGKPLKYSSIAISPTNHKSHIIFENIGDKQSSDLRIYAYFKNPDNLNFNNFFKKGGNPQPSVERPEYDLVFPMNMSGGLNPKESLRVDYEFSYNRKENVINEDKKIQSLFVVYYGVEEPFEIPFTIVVERE